VNPYYWLLAKLKSFHSTLTPIPNCNKRRSQYRWMQLLGPFLLWLWWHCLKFVEGILFFFYFNLISRTSTIKSKNENCFLILNLPVSFTGKKKKKISWRWIQNHYKFGPLVCFLHLFFIAYATQTSFQGHAQLLNPSNSFLIWLG